MSTGVEPATNSEADRCLRCGYDLRGIPDDQPCSECGLLAERSRQKSELLVDASPGWLRSVYLGIILVLLAHLIAGVWPLVSDFVLRSIVDWGMAGATILGITVNPRTAWIAVFELDAIIFAAGTFLLTRGQGRISTGRADRWRRFALRALALHVVAIVFLIHFVARLVWSWRMQQWDFWVWMLIIALLSCGVVISLLTCIHLRRMAQRVLNPHLAEHAIIVAIGYSISMLLVLMVMLIAVQIPLVGTQGWFFVLIFVVSVPFVLFTLWSALNCLRFAFAFRKAYRGALRRWDDADRSR